MWRGLRPRARFLPIRLICGRSSGVERHLAKVKVEGSNPFARSTFPFFSKNAIDSLPFDALRIVLPYFISLTGPPVTTLHYNSIAEITFELNKADAAVEKRFAAMGADAPNAKASLIYVGARDFGKTFIHPVAAEADRKKEFPEQLWPLFGEYDLNGLTVAQKYGGLDMGYLAHFAAAEAISYYSGSVGLSYIANSNLCVNQIYLNGDEEQKKKWLPGLLAGTIHGGLAMSDEDNGSHTSNMRLAATPSEDGKGFHLNGPKYWITNGGTADVLVVYARTKPSHEKNPNDGLTAFIVDTKTPGFQAGAKIDKDSMRASGTYPLSFDNTYVPNECVLGQADNGNAVLMSGLNYERLILTAGALGLAQSSFDVVMNYAPKRMQFHKELTQHDVYRTQLTDVYGKLIGARRQCYGVAAFADEGRHLTNSKERRPFLTNADAGLLKNNVCDIAHDITYQCIKLMGGSGLVSEYPLMRNNADVILYPIGGGTENMCNRIAANDLFKPA